ncbi:hypothetical protein LSTR_LSTR003459 [Laodelphax striatellus]|uniref:Uncharacterized protein n=1 Tax=Laodelphax striatellus TaxID=195883 RepID=A0A482WYS8_LAOST|nr:hypothetical protein LSTR_LSTR003459 [Laodelphax striatellus]
MKVFIQIILQGCLILIVRSEPDTSQSLQQKDSENITLEISKSPINGVKQSNYCSEVRSDVKNTFEEAQNLNNHVSYTNSNQQSVNLETDGNTKLIKRNVNDGLKLPSFSESNFNKYSSLFSGEGIENLLDEGRDRSNDSEMKEKNHIYGPKLNDINENRKLISDSQSYRLPDTNSYYNDLDHKDYSKLFQRSGNSNNMNNDNRIFKMYPSVTYEGSREFSSVPRDDSEENFKEMQPFNELHVPPDSLIPLQMEKRSEVLLKDLEQQVDSKKNNIHEDPTISGDYIHDNSFPGSIIEKTIMNLKSSVKDYPTFGGDFHHTYDSVSFVPTEEHNNGKLNNNRETNLMEDDNIEGGASNYNVPFEPEMKSHYNDRKILDNDYNKMLNTYNNVPFEAEMKSDYSESNILNNNNYNSMLSTYNSVPFDPEMKPDYSERNILKDDFNKMLSTYNNVPIEAEMKSDYSESNILKNDFNKMLSTYNNVPFKAEMESDYSESNILNNDCNNMLSSYNNVPFVAGMKSDCRESNLLNNNVLSDLNRSLKTSHEVSDDYSTLHRDLVANIRSDIDKTFNDDNLPSKPKPGFEPKRTGRKRFKVKYPKNDDERELTQQIKKTSSQRHR